jgi:hypothetical protein
MRYDSWPDLAQACPLCGAPGCATYRGYYTRLLFCPEMEFCGRIAVRTGFCRRESRRFALLPDFVIRYRRISRLSLARFHECYRGAGGRILPAIDEWTDGLGEEFYVPLSSAHGYLTLRITAPP